jgi:predicted nucleic acid-binding protein
MNVLVDTSLWSLAFRRARGAPSQSVAHAVQELSELIREGRAFLMGPIRQELLSGISDAGQFKKLQDRLRAFADLSISTLDYERAAELSNICRKEGVQGSHVDFLICSVAERYNTSIFTMDKDFSRYAKHLSIGLHRPRA